MNLYLGLVHHPIRNKNGDLVTTAVTNLDIHDISRSCRTYGVKAYYLITPVQAQHGLVNRILGHWEQDKNGAYNPDRQDALSIAKVVNSVEEGIKKIEELHGVKPLLVVTGANFKEWDGDAYKLGKQMSVDNRPIFLLFGTGWGIHASLLEQADYRLEPLYGASPEGYNHLSVRSAVAIYLDRLTQGPLIP